MHTTTIGLTIISVIALLVAVHGRRWRRRNRPIIKRTDSAFSSAYEPGSNISARSSSTAMGCAQSSQSGGEGAAEGSTIPTTAPPRDGKSGSGAEAGAAASFETGAANTSKKQVRDSVHDINGGTSNALKDGHTGNVQGTALESVERDTGSGGDKAAGSGSGTTGHDSSAAAALAPVGAGPTVAAAVASPRNSSLDAAKAMGSNRSSFAAEGIPGAGSGRPMSALLQARGSRTGPRGSGGGASPLPVPPALDAARSSAQARMSSIQAADVMGVGGDKAATAPRGLSAAPDPLPGFQPPATVAAAYPALGALPLDTPVPLEVLMRLWGPAGREEALGMARALASLGILRLASLEDGSCWALPAPPHVAHAAAGWPAAVAELHGRLLAGYCHSKGAGAGGATTPLEGLRDDGYIIQALSHHLVGAGRLEELRLLLLNPGWLEAKLHAYGVGAVVRDFRRYLQESPSDSEAAADVKLLLQAFQLSLGAAMEHPACRMMREQVLARLMEVAAQGGRLKDWFAEQAAKCTAESMLAANSRLLHLMPRSPSLAQAGGVQRMTLRGHSGPIPPRGVAIAPNCCEVITISEDGSAQVWDMNIGDCVLHLARSSPLTAVAITPDSAAAVVAAADGTAAVWSLASGQVIHTLRGHTARITSLAIDKQGIRAVTGSEDRTARVWDLAGGECEAVLRGHGGASGLVGSVLDVAVCSDGTLAATASDDFSARVWDLDEDGEQLHVLEGHGGWVTSAAWVGTSHRLVTASHDATARIWDALRGRCLFVLSGHSGRLNRVGVDPGGSWAVTASDDRTARVWDCETGEMKLLLEGHSAHVTDAAVTRDGRKIITVSGDGTCAMWDMSSGDREALLEGHSGEVAAVVLTQRGRFAVTAGEDCTARVWDLAAAAERAKPPPSHDGRVSALQALPDGHLVVSAGDDGRVFLWDPVEGVCLKRLEGHRAAIRFLRVSADGERVLTGSGDRQINHWNWAEYSAAASVVGARRSLERREVMLHTLATTTGTTGSMMTMPATYVTGGGGGGAGARGGGGRALSTFGTCSPVLSTGGVTAGSGGNNGGKGRGGGNGDGGSGRSSEEDPMTALAALKPPAAAGGGAAPAPRVSSLPPSAVPGRLLTAAAAAAGTGNGSAPRPASSSSQATTAPTGGDGAAANGTATGGGGGVRTSLSLLEVVSTLHDPLRTSMPAQQGSRVKHMAFDAACRTAAVLLFDSTVSVWDVASGRCVAQLIRRGERDAARTHSGGVNAVYLTRDGCTAVTISKDNTARVWDVASATTRFVVSGHTECLVAADISPDEQLLATAAYDKTVRVSRLSGGAPVAVLDHPQPPSCVAFSPNSRWMAVGLEDNTVVVWDLVGRCCLPSLDAHKATLAALVWSPDSRFLATAGADCTLRLWRSEDGRQSAFFMGDAALTAACWAGHPAWDIVVVGDAAGTVHFLDFAEELQGW